jgi:hypothetical protein
MTTTDLAPRAPVAVDAVLDDPELAWRPVCEQHGPYAHVLIARVHAASLTRTGMRRGEGHPDAVGVLVDDELMTMPIYAATASSSRECTSPGSRRVLHNERLIAAAGKVFDAEIVAPAHRVLQPHRTDAAEPQAHRRPRSAASSARSTRRGW